MAPASPVALSAYGKLPLSKEFLRFHCVGGAVGQFYQWVNAGFDHSSRFGGGRGERLELTWRLLFHADGQKELIAAILRDSADNEELRRFPFTCYAPVPRESLPESPESQLASLESLWAQLAESDRTLSAERNLEGFRERFKDIVLVPPTPTTGLDLATIPLAPIVEALGRRAAPAGDPRRAFTSTLYDLAKAVRILDSRKIPGERIPALRIPVDARAHVLVQARAWLSCLAPCGFLSARRTPITVAMPLETGAEADLWLVIRPPRASDFSMFAARPQGHFLPDPGGTVTHVSEEPYAAFGARVEAALLAEERTLADLGSFRLV